MDSNLPSTVTITQNELELLTNLSKVFVASGMFPDLQTQSQAIVKMLAGREFNLGPFQAVRSIDIIKGKTSLNAGFVSARIKQSGKYNYGINLLSDTGCELEFFEGTKSLGLSRFDENDAKTAGLFSKDVYKQYPRNMYFSRALTNGARWYCPDVFGGAVYTPDELEVATPVPSRMQPLAVSDPQPLIELNGNEEGELTEELLDFSDEQMRRDELPPPKSSHLDMGFRFGYYRRENKTLRDLKDKPNLIQSYLLKFGKDEYPEFLAAVGQLFYEISYDPKNYQAPPKEKSHDASHATHGNLISASGTKEL